MHVKTIKNEQKEVLPSFDNVEEKSEKGKILLPGKGGKSCENSDCPSNFLILCLKSIQSALQQDVLPSIAKKTNLHWLMNGELSCRSVVHPELTYWRQVELVLPWMISTAADAIARKEKEGLFLTCLSLYSF